MASYSASMSSPKPKTKLVKPILKKFTQSENNSLDLNRPATEQGLGFYASDHGTGSRSVHDVSFQSARRGYHTRTTSGASQFSTATTGSGPRNGSFVHPFQQTPRPYTPPLAQSYQASLLSEVESPTLADDELHPTATTRPVNLRTTSNLSSGSTSFHEITSPSLPALRILTKNNSSSRLAPGSVSQSNLHSSSFVNSPDLISPADTMSPISTIRTSMDAGFRLRSRSEGVDHSVPRPDVTAIQEAKRKFQAKERLKQEKAELAEVRALERRNLKEARLLEKSSRSKSVNSDNTATGSKRSKSDLTAQEKGDGFMAQDYNSIFDQTPPTLTDNYDDFEAPRRRRTTASTKKKTHSAWTTFMMWLRTRFLRMGKSSRDK